LRRYGVADDVIVAGSAGTRSALEVRDFAARIIIADDRRGREVADVRVGAGGIGKSAGDRDVGPVDPDSIGGTAERAKSIRV
jgi:hypothetical protein